MHLTFLAKVDSQNTGDDGRRKTYRSCLFGLISNGHQSSGVSFIASQKSNLCTRLQIYNSTKYNCLSLSLTHTHTHNTTELALTYLKWNTSVTGHKQGTVGFPQRKNLPRSTANSSVSISTLQFNGR